MPPSAVVLGEALIDLLEQPDGSFRPAVGGAPLNVAAGLARLGTPTRLVSGVGTDPFATTVLGLLTSAGVALTDVTEAPGPTPLAVASFQGAEPSFSFYGDLPIPQLDPVTVAEAAVLYCGSIALLTPFVEVARAAWAIPGPQRVFDPNLRPFLLGSAGVDGVRAIVEEFVATADLLKLSDADARLLYPDLSPVSAALRLRSLGARTVVLTLGAAGAVLVRPDRGARPSAFAATSIHYTDTVIGMPAHPGPVVDTTGCGDSVAAALMHRMASGLPDEDQAWISALQFALRVAAHVAARPGGAVAMPSLADVSP
ncbi:MAG: carbohydrate kinase [Hamadaea sp.]|uniref:carbohydrate kinase family protein n=1 Tax=Hamadaea sp. TaxID=2024425 RepID=UPI0017AB1919|nr:PfkB family carbohydrate kinase [Hamadaea sp.]NUR70468.1 carbohydrate kinase [Hamadaea sp.]NUT18267.1 carbohydrate kinase [Hamadaea sp.]